MRLTGKKILTKLKLKETGHTKLLREIDQLISDLEDNDFHSFEELRSLRPDADRVHHEGFYFFNINIHRTLILVEIEANGEATIVWAENLQEYERIFKNNKAVIEKWLKNHGWVN